MTDCVPKGLAWRLFKVISSRRKGRIVKYDCDFEDVWGSWAVLMQGSRQNELEN